MPQVFPLGDFPLSAGGTLTDAKLSYATFGKLNPQRDNAILLGSYYGGTAKSYLPMIGPGEAFDPERWFIVLVDMFGNGRSTSPSNWSASSSWPRVGIGDMVVAQRLLIERLEIQSLALAAGWSMGAMQALHWGMRYPDFVKRIFAWCGTAHCWPLNRLFLDGAKAALLADTTPRKKQGIRAFARVYAGWAYSADFHREELWRTLRLAELRRAP